MGALVSLVAVAVLALFAVVAVASDELRLVFGAVIPGVAFAVFLCVPEGLQQHARDSPRRQPFSDESRRRPDS